MKNKSFFHTLTPVPLIALLAGGAYAMTDDVARLSGTVLQTSMSFCSNVAPSARATCQGDMIAAGSRVVVSMAGLPPKAVSTIEAAARDKLPAGERPPLAATPARADFKDDDIAGLAGMVRLCDVYEQEPAARKRHLAAVEAQDPDTARRVEALLADSSASARARVSMGVWEILAVQGPDLAAGACARLGAAP
ncbi:hypothetical protein DID96_32565 [Burkholderia sp. Bp8963]|uniref:hypothetical protein n=1 Tax=Burkholderia sp. Bp8963 TaxID=2184547 RepID=UPI000F5B4471|nr:hypothetical protein [Burkholderia sp. Bp8963]RQS61821.1 hypothetical protein DID96_32565 [Burkholderia sp. Bp8963]